MTSPTTELTEKQQAVLTAIQEGKTPTEIGAELGITSQAVHGHLRRLREHGLVPDTGAPKPAASARTPRSQRPNGRSSFDPATTIAAVRSAADDQRRLLDAREAEIDGEIEALKAEKKTITATRTELNKLVPPEPAA